MLKFSLINYLAHLGFEGLATLGGYYARGFCNHTWHRIAIAVIWAMVSTLLLVTFLG